MKDFGSSRGRNALLRSGVSLAALATLGIAGVARAQDAPGTAPADEEDTIVVVGVRAALESAATIKRDADTVVDSITATDIGAFPDTSVAGALQRVPGISVSRLQSTDDSTHPSGEPAGVLIRGLTFVRTEFNGRDSFSADAYRGLNFNDISPELMAGVDAYKNQTADMIEGGIAGSVNLRTRLPFDQSGLVVTGNIKASYGDRADKWTGEFSALVSNTWETAVGKFGLMADYARSHVVTRTESVIMDKIDLFCSAGATNADGSGIVQGGEVQCTGNPFGGSGWAYIPDGVRYSQVDYDRTREGMAFAAQFESTDGSFRATAQYTNSEYHNAWLERASHVIFEGNYYGSSAFRVRGSTILGPASGTPAFVFGADGMLESGIVTQGHGSWRGSWNGTPNDAIDTGSAVAGLPFVNACGAPLSCSTLQDGLYIQNEARNFDHKEGTQDFSGRIEWDISDRVKLSLDGQYIDAFAVNDDILVATGTMANAQYRTNEDGTPEITLLPGSNVNYASGGLSNPHNYWMPFVQAHLEDNDATATALRADLEYDFGDGSWLDSLKVGVRYGDRNQKVRYSTFNWSPVAASWNCNGPGFNIDNTSPAPYPAACGHAGNFQGYGEGMWESVSLGDGFFNGSAYNNVPLVYMNRETLLDRQRIVDGLSGSAVNTPLQPGWSQICDRGDATIGCFTPSEVMDVTEKTKAAYAMLRFGGDGMTLGGMSVRGNIGLRVVQTDIDSSGAVGFPNSTWIATLDGRPCADGPATGDLVNVQCFLTPQIRAFANSGSSPNSLEASYTHWLPSFNIRFGLDDKNYVRFGYSRAMSRPDFGLLRNFASIQSPVIDGRADSPYLIRGAGGAVTGYNFVFRAESGYGALEPITADQFDITFEHYAGRSSSFHVDAFYKKLNGSISYGEFVREFTNNGSTQTVLLRGPRNQEDGGELYGFEVGFQTFFDFLPGLLSGLGTQLNYTLVEQSGINNSNLVVQGALDSGGTGGFGAGLDVSGGRGIVIDSHKLAGISKHTFNAVALYEKGPVALRLAYNWRSRFLTNNLDCCIGLPVFQKAAGFLDGSVRFSVNDWLEVAVEGQNLLDTTLVYQQQIFGDSAATPGADPVFRDANWSKSDRRFSVGARVKF